jgi:hypothetical protein
MSVVLPEQGAGEITITNLAGTIVKKLMVLTDAGLNIVPIKGLGNLQSGMYIVRFQQGVTVFTERMIVANK